MKISFKDHGEIIAAISAGNGISADHLMQQHISVGADDFADLVAKLSHYAMENVS
jgi:DNA-binding FadR family transcriptional regulator